MSEAKRSERDQPASIDVDRAAGITIVWEDGHRSRFELEALRTGCMCATCRGLRDQGHVIWPKPSDPLPLAITDAQLTGGWGLSVSWNDGHSTGIYAFERLRAWCPCPECS